MQDSDFVVGDLTVYRDSNSGLHQGFIMGITKGLLRFFRFTRRDVVIITMERCVHFQTHDIDIMCEKSWWNGLIADCCEGECIVLDGRKTDSELPELLLQPKHNPEVETWVMLDCLILIGHELGGLVTKPSEIRLKNNPYLGLLN